MLPNMTLLNLDRAAPTAAPVPDCKADDWEVEIVECMIWNELLHKCTFRGCALDMENMLKFAASSVTPAEFLDDREDYLHAFIRGAFKHRNWLIQNRVLKYRVLYFFGDDDAFRRAARCVFYHHYPKNMKEAAEMWWPYQQEIERRDREDKERRAAELRRDNEAKANRAEEARAAGAKYWWSM